MQKIVTFFMFNDQAEEATKFYASVFKDSKITSPMSFELAGQEFYAYNGGPSFEFSQGMSQFINCEDQDEVDYYWEKLAADGGHHDQCGWLQDKFGVSWQVIPTVLMKHVSDPDPVKSKRVFDAMLKMHKIIVADIERAYKGE